MAQQNDGSLEAGRRLYSVHDVRHRYVWFLRTMLASVWLSFVGMFAAMAIADWILPFCPQNPHTAGVIVTIFIVFMGGMLAVLLNSDRIFGLSCGACGKRIDLNDVSLAIAIHACPHCRVQLFDEWPVTPTASIPAEEGASQLLALADIELAEKAQTHHFLFSVLKTGLMAVAVFGMTRLCLFFLPIPSDLPDGLLEQSLAIVTGGIAVLVGMVRSLRYAASRYPAKCPTCADLIHVSQILKATGNCLNCGCRVLRDADFVEGHAQNGAAPLLDRTAYRSASDRFTRQGLWLCMGIMGSSGAVYGWLVSSYFGHPLNREISFREIGLVYAGIFALVGVGSSVPVLLLRGIRCPNCNHQILTQRVLIQATGNCAGCGRRILGPMPVGAKS